MQREIQGGNSYIHVGWEAPSPTDLFLPLAIQLQVEKERKAVLLLLSAQRWPNLLLVLEIWCLVSLLKMWFLTTTSCALARRAGLLVKVRLGASGHGPTVGLHLKSVKEGYLHGSFNLV